MPSFEDLLRRREGCEYTVYADSVHKKPTVGIGHLVVAADKLKLGDEIDDARVKAFFKVDSVKALAAARKQAGMVKINDKQFIIYLASVNFQLGTGWFRKFKKVWAHMKAADYENAATEVQKSRWFKQTPKRGKDFQKALLRLAGKAGKDEDDDK